MKWFKLRYLDGYLPPEMEEAYRQHYLKTDSRVVAFTLTFFSLMLVAFAYNDYVMFGPGTTFYFLITLRVLYLAYYIGLMIFLRKNRSPGKYDLSLAVALAASFILITAINLSRPPSNVGTFAVDIILILAIYLGLPTRMGTRAGGALALSLAELLIFIFYRQAAAGPYIYTLFVVLVTANALGLYASSRLYLLRRGQFKARSQQARALEALRKSSELLAETGQMAKVGGWEFDAGSDKQRWTEEIYRIHELPPEYKPTVAEGINFYAPEAVPTISKAVQDTLDTGKSFDLELPMITAKGKYIWVHAIGRGHIKDGKVVKVSGTFQDITDRKLAEEKQEQAAAEMRDLYNNTPAGHHSVDVNGILIRINDTELSWLGCSREEVIGKKKFSDFLTPSSLEIYQREFRIFKETGWVKDVALDIVGKNGVVISVLVSSTTAKDKAGNYVMSRSTIYDVTEIKMLQRQISESEQRYRTILEEMNDAYYEMDPDGNFTMANNTTCRMLLTSKEELLGTSYKLYIKEEDDARLRVAFDNIWTTGNPSKGIPYTAVRKDGSTFNAEVSVSPMKDEHGTYTGYRCVARDITERLEFQDKLAEMAMHDALTGLPNRSLFYDHFYVAHAQAERNNRKMAVLELDLDHFKLINDTMGHAAGDELLKAAAALMSDVVRKSDTVARFGGDEFAVLLPEIEQVDDAIATAKKILAAFSHPFKIGNEELNVTTSIGIAIYPDHGDTIDELLKTADTALYYTKGHGRNNYRLAEESKEE